ncbi:hypothetical protein TNCV_931151 [Trichonephila clavipes]|uniref:Uncharacterized protein n=1 Tax=Trichonephila clavipes TaxID=2585209 RepID=A0A8X7BDT9_TRICX|nr:hypothetical protein TNCV_931151 [Trichonephila clavipes]
MVSLAVGVAAQTRLSFTKVQMLILSQGQFSLAHSFSQSLVYADKPQTLDHLEDNIRRVIADIRPQMLKKSRKLDVQIDYIRASRVSPMPEIIFKMHPPKSCWLPHRGEGVPERMGEERWELAPGRSTLDVKAFPLCSAKINRNWSQDRLLPSGAPILDQLKLHFRFI